MIVHKSLSIHCTLYIVVIVLTAYIYRVSCSLCSGLELILLQELAEIQMHSDAARYLSNLDWGKTQAHYKNIFRKKFWIHRLWQSVVDNPRTRIGP